MNKKLLRRIIAWVGLVAAVAFAPLMVIYFLQLTSGVDKIVSSLLWVTLALAVICFGIAKFVITVPDETEPPLGDTLGNAGEADDSESYVDNGDDEIPDGEGNENGEEKDNGGGN